MCVCVEIKPNPKTDKPILKTEDGQMVLYLPTQKFQRLFPEASNPLKPRKVVLVYQDDKRIIVGVEFPEQKNVRLKQFTPALFWGDIKALTRWV